MGGLKSESCLRTRSEEIGKGVWSWKKPFGKKVSNKQTRLKQKVMSGVLVGWQDRKELGGKTGPK